ncbi:uncharacterized protein [Nicotiana tomentosiformis]|uniref:uncharacterized protein n=1 Tax=Nicotiana tomentosiformis TaxID=4098 RepID=UPI00388C4C7C
MKRNYSNSRQKKILTNFPVTENHVTEKQGTICIRFGSVAFGGERDVRMQTVKNSPDDCQQGETQELDKQRGRNTAVHTKIIPRYSGYGLGWPSEVMSSGGTRGGWEVGQGLGGGKEGKGGKGNKGAYRLRIGSWNVGTLMGKSIEFAKILRKRRVNIACVRETRWVGSRARIVDNYKLWYSGVRKGKNRVDILVDGELRELVVEVRWVNDRLMTIKLVVGECTLNIISAYAPHAGLDEEVKQRFWEGLDEIVRQVSPTERLFIGVEFNGHIGSTA